jgi:hypothetical protein
MVVDVEAAASVRVVPGTAVPDTTVVITSAAPNPLLPLNVNAPTSPFEILETVTVGSFVFVKEQTILLPGAVARALSVIVPDERFGVAVPAPVPVQDAAATA